MTNANDVMKAYVRAPRREGAVTAETPYAIHDEEYEWTGHHILVAGPDQEELLRERLEWLDVTIAASEEVNAVDRYERALILMLRENEGRARTDEIQDFLGARGETSVLDLEALRVAKTRLLDVLNGYF